MARVTAAKTRQMIWKPGPAPIGGVVLDSIELYNEDGTPADLSPGLSFTWGGEWSSGTDYVAQAVVKSPANYSLYIAKEDIEESATDPSGDPDNWDLFLEAPPSGEMWDPNAMRFVGTWTDEMGNAANEVVRDAGGLYIAKGNVEPGGLAPSVYVLDPPMPEPIAIPPGSHLDSAPGSPSHAQPMINGAIDITPDNPWSPVFVYFELSAPGTVRIWDEETQDTLFGLWDADGAEVWSDSTMDGGHFSVNELDVGVYFLKSQELDSPVTTVQRRPRIEAEYGAELAQSTILWELLLQGAS